MVTKKEYMKAWRAKNKDHLKEYMDAWHNENKEHETQYRKEYYQENKTEMSIKRREYNQRNHESVLQKWRDYNKANSHKRTQWKRQNKDRINMERRRMYQSTRAKKNKIYTQKIKNEVLSHYSSNDIPICACCGEKELLFLTLDHINGNGSQERKKVGGGWSLYLFLRKNNYPNGYQVLCWNCNSGRALNGGICPHKKTNSEELPEAQIDRD